ncbi:MAG: PhoH family protein [Candidatus Omnitrophica bacterium]|nr:PhoH family protein [Candidatus Omnitrophota bacterium]
METSIQLESNLEAQRLFGEHDSNIKLVEKAFKVKITLRQDMLKIKGPAGNIAGAREFIERFLALQRQDPGSAARLKVRDLLNDAAEGDRIQAFEAPEPRVQRLHAAAHPKAIGPKTKGQREYVEAIKGHDIVFGIGPAGTGKTYLAMACAVEAFKKQEVRRIILTRPAIEAGESLGYLPGDMYEKISPYLRPLYDALYDMMEANIIERYLENGIIEVAPLAYMRGRTLNDAFIVLDEAQNCTVEQMKMFLTRLGFDSKAVITGDITQSDLPGGKPLGLLQAIEILKDVGGIKFSYFSGSDVVRHPLVQRIIEAYDKAVRIKQD